MEALHKNTDAKRVTWVKSLALHSPIVWH